ncbi:MAG: hypothetical protein ACRDNK_04270 [Solirubrobacteraceae bacterium]
MCNGMPCDGDCDNQMLEYETEHEQPPTITPVPVTLAEPAVTVETVPQHVTCVSVALPINTVAQILQHDPLRVRATILPRAAGIVLCHSYSQAQDPANLVGTPPAPNGAYVPATPVSFDIKGTQAMWAIAPGGVATTVGLIIERRSE